MAIPFRKPVGSCQDVLIVVVMLFIMAVVVYCDCCLFVDIDDSKSPAETFRSKVKFI